MSRIGKKPVPVPKGVEVELDGSIITVKGPKGALSQEIPARISVEVADGEIRVTRPSDNRLDRSMHGLTRALIANMVHGVTEGFEKSLEIIGTGYRASKQGETLVLQVGYSHPVEIVPENGIQIDVPSPTKITVRGTDKQLVGQTAANIRAVREPEVYHGKGIRYAGERVALKAGKAGKIG
ncbi:MAG: 50S ribosomal protein L6 [Bacillota bacterium]|jgi:large subunit ribosomal protein L6|nr:50S ribosomal protein L6 [Bacillota bacterium]HOO30381.1 50S ribosomal protein L6 [Bacillota bacterium]HPZ13356.1 50S ribosomal protein L6 [Bacillota bacterium]HQD79460.1 50S ribosomal protein L6 [Bacillota bacterium]